MSRRPPSDHFTRFTSSQPHAVSKPSSSSSSSSPSPSSSSFSSNLTADPRPTQAHASTPDNETPAEKVARLRAAARAARASQTTPVDRVIASSRTWADRAHRITTYGLIGLTGVSAVVAAYSLTSLVTHNRRQKRAWIEREMDRLHDARQAFLRGDASAEQLHLLEQERAGDEIARKWKEDRDKRKSESYWGRIKAMVAGEAAKGEMGAESAVEKQTREYRSRRDKDLKGDAWVEGEIRPTASGGSAAVAVAPRGTAVPGVGLDSKGRPVPSDRIEYVARDVDGNDGTPMRTAGKGGLLDQYAQNAVGAVMAPAESSGWLSWIRGGGKS